METKANYVAVGAFVLACVIGLVVTIMWLAGVQYAQEYSYYTATFKGPVTGLGKGTVTRFNGVRSQTSRPIRLPWPGTRGVIATIAWPSRPPKVRSIWTSRTAVSPRSCKVLSSTPPLTRLWITVLSLGGIWLV